MNAVICVFVALLAVVFAAEPIPLGPTPPLPTTPSNIEVLQVYPLPNPEEVSVDPTETFFLTGGNDGYMYKVDLESGASEVVLTPRDFNPTAFEGMTDEEMRAFCNGEIPDEVTCGRILGIRFSQKSAKKVYVANSYFGIYLLKLRRNGNNKLFQLVDKTGSFINDVLEAGRYVFYTDSHTTKQRNAVPYAVMDLDAPQGSLNVYDKWTRQATCLIQGIFFANGIALSSDGNYLYISETTAARIRRFNIRTFTEEDFLTQDLPIYTDNIYLVESSSCGSSRSNSHSHWHSHSRTGSGSRGSGSRSGSGERKARGWGHGWGHGSSSSSCDNDGTLLVPGYWRHPDLDALLRDPAALEAHLQTPPSYHLPLFQSWILPVGVLLQVSEATGEVTKITFDNTFKFLLAASAHKLSGENEYIIGSVFAPQAVRIRLLD